MQIYEALAENDFTRSDIIVTLGGGVAGDMGGFAAATFLRGIDFVQCHVPFGAGRCQCRRQNGCRFAVR